ncbi:MAG: hypothetical protein ABIP13_10645 [Tepidiformaceae bacterium]
MSRLTKLSTDSTEVAPSRGLSPEARADLRTVGYWITLGAGAGASGGLLIGGIVGRLAMFALRLTSDNSVRGIESDDGFTIGQFNLLDTLNLLAVGTVMGTLVGLIVVFGRPFFPRRGMPIAWGLAGAAIGGALLVNSGGVDFRALGPHWFAVALFIAIPAVGAGLIAWLTELYPKFWWRNRKATLLAAIPILPSVVVVLPAVLAIFVGFLWFLAMQWPAARTLPEWMPTRVLAIAVFGLMVVLGLLDLVGDTRAIV